MGTGHYGGASMALPVGSVLVLGIAMLQPLVLLLVLVGVALVGLAALLAIRR